MLGREVKPQRVSGVLLSAGQGARLRPLSYRVPKAVFPMLDVPLGAFGLRQLLECSPSAVVNVDARVRSIIEEALEPLADFGAITFAEESPEPFGTGGTLASLRDDLAETIVTWNADAIINLDLSAMLEAHRAQKGIATIAVVPVARGADISYGEGRAAAYIDRRRRPEADGGRFLGVAVFEHSALGEIPPERPVGLAEALLEPLTGRGELAVFEHRGYAMDVGTFSRYLEASIDLLQGRGPDPPLPWPGDVVTVKDRVAYLGPGARAKSGSLGPGAILLEGAEVRKGAFVERSVVWPGTVVPEGERVTDSVWF